MQQPGAELTYVHHFDTVEMTGVGSGSDVCNAQIRGQTVKEEKKSGVSVCLCVRWRIQGKHRVIEPDMIWLFPPMCAKLLQLCLILCEPMACSPPGSSVHGDSPGKSTGGGFHALF